MTGPSTGPAPAELPGDLVDRIQSGGYYPDLVADTLDVAVAGEPVRAHLVHGETTFDSDTVRRHLSVIVLTTTRLIFVHVDDHGTDDEHGAFPHAYATSESVALSAVRSVVTTHVVSDPQRYRAGALGREVNLTINWGGVSRVDLEPADCPDPSCEADHGYTGALVGDDVTLRISADAEGGEAVTQAVGFARLLSAVIAGR